MWGLGSGLVSQELCLGDALGVIGEDKINSGIEIIMKDDEVTEEMCCFSGTRPISK